MRITCFTIETLLFHFDLVLYHCVHPPIRQNLQPVASNVKCPRRLLKQIEEPMKKIRLTRHEISCFTAECEPHGIKSKIKLSLFEILIVVLFIIFIFHYIIFISYSKIEML